MRSVAACLARDRISEKRRLMGHQVGTPEKVIRRLDPNAAHDRRDEDTDACLYSGQ